MWLYRFLRKNLLWIAGFVSFMAIIWVAISVLKPLPPRHIVFATGPEGGGYSAAGKRYKAILARHGVTVRLVATPGSLDNLARLQDPASGVDVGFVQAGTANEETSSGISSLGTIFYSPVWFFCRGPATGLAIHDLPGPRLSLGQEGSAARAFALILLTMNGKDISKLDLRAYGPEEAAAKLEAGEIDGALIVSGWDSPIVRRLLGLTNIGIYNFSQADAYIALLPYLNKVVVPAGLGNLAANHPSSDITLLAPKTSLVVRNSLHPALQFLLLHAATQIHSGPDAFHRPGQFPAAEVVDLPLSDEARSFYKSGPSLLQRHLPFWLAELVHRLLVIVVPAAGIVYPLIILITKGYRWLNRFQIFRLYGELKLLELGLQAAATDQRAELLARLLKLEERTGKLKVPNSQSDLSYTLKSHIALVRENLQRQALTHR